MLYRRTRDQKILDTCDVVADVGGVYDPAKHRYDHHQRCIARLESAYGLFRQNLCGNGTGTRMGHCILC